MPPIDTATSTASTRNARLVGVAVQATDFPRAINTFKAICGVEPHAVGSGAGHGHNSVRFVLNDDDIRISASSSSDTGRGIERLTLTVDDFETTLRALTDAGAMVRLGDGSIEIDKRWAGVTVDVREGEQETFDAVTAGAELDHVALLVGDLEVMAARWTVILGSPPATFGVHPLGTCLAARFLLGPRMIEIIAPLPDGHSTLHTRHERAGDGPFALAIVATDLERTTSALAATGALVLHQPPHLIVHPADAAGVPIQLTPRVHHDRPPHTHSSAI